MRGKLSFAMVVAIVLTLTAGTLNAFADRGYGVYGGCALHHVRYGDTLYSIGRYYGVHPHVIARANNLYNPNYIRAGTVLCVPRGYGYSYYDSYDDHGYGAYNRYSYRSGMYGTYGYGGAGIPAPFNAPSGDHEDFAAPFNMPSGSNEDFAAPFNAPSGGNEGFAAPFNMPLEGSGEVPNLYGGYSNAP